MNQPLSNSFTRRDALKTSAALAGTVLASGLVLPRSFASGVFHGGGRLKVGVIGCGGRGSGAAVNSISASPDTEIYAMGDVFQDRIDGSLAGIVEECKKNGVDASRINVPKERQFVGIDAYKKVLATDCDIVILATAPGFRPTHFEAAVAAGKHIFFEKPVAVDPAGIRKVIAAANLAKEKKLCVVTGTQRRHENCYLEWSKRLQDGQIGKVMAAQVYWNQGSLWHHDHDPKWSDLEWQVRNWLYFAWLSGDHIVEQHVHNLDVANWAMGGHPLRCWATGGRQVRTGPSFGHIFDHFAVEYEYSEGRTVHSYCRQIDGCDNRVEEVVVGTEGRSVTSSGNARLEGKNAWKFKGDNPDPYTQEHRDLVAAIKGGAYINEGVRVAESTMTAIMARMAAYTGKTVTWDFAMNSKLDLTPPHFDMGKPLPVAEVAVPGNTPLV